VRATRGRWPYNSISTARVSAPSGSSSTIKTESAHGRGIPEPREWRGPPVRSPRSAGGGNRPLPGQGDWDEMNLTAPRGGTNPEPRAGSPRRPGPSRGWANARAYSAGRYQGGGAAGAGPAGTGPSPALTF